MKTKTIQLPSGGEAVLKASLTNRDRIRVSGAGTHSDIITTGLRVVLMEYNGKLGNEAFEAFLDSTDAKDFEAVTNEASKVVNGVTEAPKE